MTQAFPPLPEGAVFCATCASAGEKVSMEPEDALTLELRRKHDDEGLQSYRCPECESVQVFRVD